MNNWNEYIKKFNENDKELYIQMISNSEVMKWIEEEVPKFECPNKLIEETYYFRWWTFRKHIKKIPDGRIITEFLPAVHWSGSYNSINSAVGHHLAEARWLKKDQQLTKEYLNFWLKGEGKETAYSSWMIYGAYQSALVMGERDFVIDLLPEMNSLYKKVEKSNWTKYGLFWSCDDRDAMEMSISGSGLRPTLNSYMYANAYALSRIASWAGEKDMAQEYAKRASNLKLKICEVLWDEIDEFFKVIPLDGRNEDVENFIFEDIPLDHNAREAIGYIPWSFHIPDKKHDIAWKFLNDKRYFQASYGPTTAERRHPLFMKQCKDHECLWNGPSWPFATTQILNGMIELLQQGRETGTSKKEFLELISIYSKEHYRIKGTGEVVNWIDENLEPDTGEWISRTILKNWNWKESKGGYERGKDYNHSTFCDLVIRGICGIEISEENQLVVNPLIPKNQWSYFLLEDLPYQGHFVTIGFDADGMRYQKGQGLFVEIDGECKARTKDIEKICIYI